MPMSIELGATVSCGVVDVVGVAVVDVAAIGDVDVAQLGDEEVHATDGVVGCGHVC